MTYAEDSEKWEMKKQRFWEKRRETPEHQTYIKFWKRYHQRETPGHMTEIPLIGIKDVKDPFEINEYYHKHFFLFEPDTPPMEKISLDKAIEKDFRFLGRIPNICWGFTRIPGHSLDTYHSYATDELFMALGRFFKKGRNQIPPKYFGLDVSGSRVYGDNPSNWEFGVNSPLYILTFFGERK